MFAISSSGACAGPRPKIWAALVHDPSRNNGDSYDGNGLGIQPFIDALRAAIKEADVEMAIPR